MAETLTSGGSPVAEFLSTALEHGYARLDRVLNSADGRLVHDANSLSALMGYEANASAWEIGIAEAEAAGNLRRASTPGDAVLARLASVTPPIGTPASSQGG